MNSFRLALLVTLVAALWVAGTAQAGQREGAFSLSPMVGYHGFEGDQNTDDDFVGGLSLGYNISKRWAAELELRYTNAEFGPSGSKQDMDIASIGVNALYHFNPDGAFVPYVSAGFGALLFNWGAVDNDTDDEDFMMNWGVGAKYFISDNTALRADLRHLVDFHSDRAWDHNGDDNLDHNYLATAGLYWQFGGPPPTPPAPLDSDGDGIADMRDKCPDTPTGVLVDAVGCPPAGKTPPPPPQSQPVIDGDNDGDGVPNSHDKCPGTEAGVIVDEDGCPVKFTLQIEFDFDKSQVRPEYHEKLRMAADFINKYPETQFLLAGYTDSIGSDTYNKGLSLRRAAAVKKYLVEEFGIAAHLMAPRGYGESQPVASNETAEGRQRNRRVEVICCILIPPE